MVSMGVMMVSMSSTMVIVSIMVSICMVSMSIMVSMIGAMVNDAGKHEHGEHKHCSIPLYCTSARDRKKLGQLSKLCRVGGFW